MDTDKIVVLGGARTAIGSFGGTLASVPAHELGAVALIEAARRSGVTVEDVDEVVMGQVGQVGPDAYNARRVALAAGVPDDVPSFNVNRLCGSGLQALWSGAQRLRWGGAEVVAVGGNESMSRMPFYDFAGRDGWRLATRELVDGTLLMLTDPFTQIPMGMTAEIVAEKYGVSRLEQDEFALESQRRAATSEAQAVFAEEIVRVEVRGRRGTSIFDRDEHPRPATTADDLAGLRPAFKSGGSVTAGNSSGINDGASALILTTERYAIERGLQPLAILEEVTVAAMAPELMGYAPVLALRDLFERTGLGVGDIGVFECNEAFAAQAAAVVRDAGLPPERTNPYGGAIALGHPVGATGATLSLRAVLDLARRNHEFAVVTMCIGGGQAMAAVFRRVA